MRRATPLAVVLMLAIAAGMAAPSTTHAGSPRATAAGSASPDGATAPSIAAAADGTDAVGGIGDPSDPVNAPVSTLSAAGRYIVLLKDGRSLPAARARAEHLGIRADRTFSHVAKGWSARLDGDQLAALRADPDVQAVVPDEVISLTGQYIPMGVRRIHDRESTIAQIDGTDTRVDADVAIVDTGISKTHEDLNVVGGVSCATDNPNSWGDANGHGTHVAGIVGAKDDGLGVVGVAPGVRLWAVRILDGGGNGLVSWYVCGLDWITAQRDPLDPTRPLIEAANMSVAKDGSDDNNCGLTNHDAIHQAICRLVASGVTVVAAAGNNHFNAARLKPASYNEVITVSALADTDGKPGGLGGHLCFSWGSYDTDDTFANFSNYGADVDLIAPGKCIWSTLPGNRYGYMSGTSMAAPHVTGAVALYKASRPTATPAQVRAALRAAGTMDWRTSTDPDSTHEPLLDVSHIVNVDDFTVDATPGTSRSALFAGTGGTTQVPISLVRGEAFPGAVTLSVTGSGGVTGTPAVSRLTGQDAVSTTMTITVPSGTAGGTHTLTVTATDGTRTRTSTFPVVVDATKPVAHHAVLGLRTGSTLGAGLNTTATWSGASDASGIGRYEVRWTTDGTAGATTVLASSARSATLRTAVGHTYTLQLRARDGAGNWSAWVESAAFKPTLSQDTAKGLVRYRFWKRTHASWASGGTVLSSTLTGAYVRRSFTGRAVAYVASRGPRMGRAMIYIDGARVKTVDLGSATTRHQVVLYTRSWASAGVHVIMVKVAGTSGRPRVELDTFVVVP